MTINLNPMEASVILPIYNAEQYLHEAIISVLNQSFKNFELLLLNDGSTDNSAEIIDYYVSNDPRCRSFHWLNRGLITTLNLGISEAKADIIIRMDADDICRPDRFLKQMQFLNQHHDHVAVGSKITLIDPEGLPIGPFPTDLNHEDIDTAHLAGKGGAIAHPSVAMRKNAVIKVGGYRSEFQHAEDIDLFLRLAEVGKLANLADVLLEYRQHPNSIGYKHAQTQRASARRAIAETKKRRKITELTLAHATEDFSTATENSLSDIHRKWAWWALSAGNLKTARKYAIKVLKANPFNTENIKLLACVLRGH